MTEQDTKRSHLLDNLEKRSDAFKPNKKLDAVIAELVTLIGPSQEEVNRRFEAPKAPVVGILGCSRSGTTFLTQLLAASGMFGYPSNFLSRFSYAPYVGALIQKMLFDPEYDLRGELTDLHRSISFDSELGKTSGALEINEFFHFWRRFFPVYEPGHLSETELVNVDIGRMRRELAALETAFGLPFMSKAKLFQFNAAYFSHRMPELFFIHIRRDPAYTMQSILQSRRKYYNDENVWWSAKPKEYERIKDLSAHGQIAGQVYFTEKNISEEMEKIEPRNKFSCSYEALCAEPHRIFGALAEKLRARGMDFDMPDLPESFPCGNKLKVSADDFASLKANYEEIAGDDEAGAR